MTTIYWKRYAHKAGPHTFRGTEYYSDPDCNNLIARNGIITKENEFIVTLNNTQYKAVKAEPKIS